MSANQENAPEEWSLLRSGPGEAAKNMAVDEVLLKTARERGRPLLRFYEWTRPAATFGYFQKRDEIARWTDLRPLIRRPTGGGLVAHDLDWTYSVVVPPGHFWHRLRAADSYQTIHKWVGRAFAAAGVENLLADAPINGLPGRCFAGAERFDLLISGQKLAGAAQRRSKDGLLIQGSVRPGNASVLRPDWERSMLDCGPGWPVRWRELDWTPALDRRSAFLAAAKYSSEAHNLKR